LESQEVHCKRKGLKQKKLKPQIVRLYYLYDIFRLLKIVLILFSLITVSCRIGKMWDSEEETIGLMEVSSSVGLLDRGLW
jgi:hypothetical protein